MYGVVHIIVLVNKYRWIGNYVVIVLGCMFLSQREGVVVWLARRPPEPARQLRVRPTGGDRTAPRPTVRESGGSAE